VDAAASGAQAIAGWMKIRERSDSAQTNDAEAYGQVVWFWHPLLVSSRRRFFEPNRDFDKPLIRRRRWQDEFAHRGDHEVSRKTIAQGMPGVPGYLW
jgi:hypothetical protein